MRERIFRFKRFSVKHEKSAMKVGVDGVLIGAWATCEGRRLLDVGTGCGMIALMLAQRNAEALIDAIDIDEASAEEARDNVDNSEWADRITVKKQSFEDLLRMNKNNCYDLIVSNPPFFESGVKDPQTPRERSRHQGELSPANLVREGGQLLKEGGLLALIAPSEEYHRLTALAKSNGMIPARACFVRDNPDSAEKRVLMEFSFMGVNSGVINDKAYDIRDEVKHKSSDLDNHLVMFDSTGRPTAEYRELCRNFYLKF